MQHRSTICAENASTAPHNMVLVAAHNSDLQAAHACAHKTVLVCRPLEHCPGHRTNPTPEHDWDLVADNLIELADVLSCPLR